MADNLDELISLYSAAIYVVLTENGDIKFKIGETNEDLDALLSACNAEAFAFLTAYNPRSTELPEEENILRQDELRRDLNAAGIEFLEGYGGSEDGSWAPEPSLFLLDVSEDAAASIARKYEQHAIVYGERGSAPRLVWCE